MSHATAFAEETTATDETAATLRCLYCGSSQLKELYTRVRDRLEYVPGERSWWQCQACQSALLVPQPKVEELASFHPPVYSFTPEMGKKSPLAAFLASLEHRFFFGPQYRMQANQCAKMVGGAKNGRRLLDIGAGRGLRLVELRKLGFEVHALDLQEDVVRYLQNDLKIPAVCADVSEADVHFPAVSFDVVSAYYLMEHINDVAGFLQDCSKLLRPGGWVAIAIPFADSVQASIFGKRWINVTEAPRHLSLPTQAGALEAFRKAGFVDAKIVPDAVFNSAGAFASSLVTNGTLTHAYGRPGWRAFLPRFLGAAAMLAALPFCYWESYSAGRPPMGTVYARKPIATKGAN